MQCMCTEWLLHLESGFQGGQLTSQNWEKTAKSSVLFSKTQTKLHDLQA